MTPLLSSPLAVAGLAALASLLLPHSRVGRMLLYPFSLLSTWIHECGHAVSTLLVGGRVHEITLHANLSGSATSTRPDTAFNHAFTAAAGLLAPSLLGGTLIVLSALPSTAPYALFGVATLLLLTGLLWVRNLFGLGAITVLSGASFAAGYALSPLLQYAVLHLAGARLALESLSDVRYMFSRTATTAHGESLPSDTERIARALFPPYWFWGFLIAGASILILIASLYAALRLHAPEVTPPLDDLVQSFV
jgi:hypothetical protein